MEILEELVAKQFGNDEKFLSLKFLEIVYSLPLNTCTISFLYPQQLSFLFQQKDKEVVTKFLKEKLNLQAKLDVKFIKSYLDDELIKNACQDYIKIYHKSLASVMNNETITVKKDVLEIIINISLPEQILQGLSKEDFSNNLLKFLQKHFIAQFVCTFSPCENLDNEKISQSIDKSLDEKLKSTKPLPRYKVFGTYKLVGQDISPEPEFLSNIKNSKPGVILAGTISHFVKKSYKRVKKNKEVEKYYYKFILHEENKTLPIVYFCPKINITKMDKLADDTQVLMVVDIKKEANGFNGYMRSLSLCEINSEVYRHSKEKILNYTTIFPERYSVMTQSNIFDVEKHFTPEVENNTYVVFDVETTGLEAEDCEIIEIGAVKVSGGCIIEKFQTLIKPQNSIPHLITEITDIDDDMVANAPTIENVIKDFYLFTRGTILAGYNVNFDMKFIQKAGLANGVNFDNDVFDVLPLARQKLQSKNYKLGTIVETLNLTLDNAHRAFYDALATAEVMLELSKVDKK